MKMTQHFSTSYFSCSLNCHLSRSSTMSLSSRAQHDMLRLSLDKPLNQKALHLPLNWSLVMRLSGGDRLLATYMFMKILSGTLAALLVVFGRSCFICFSAAPSAKSSWH
jgi:hypothetical protein